MTAEKEQEYRHFQRIAVVPCILKPGKLYETSLNVSPVWRRWFSPDVGLYVILSCQKCFVFSTLTHVEYFPRLVRLRLKIDMRTVFGLRSVTPTSEPAG